MLFSDAQLAQRLSREEHAALRVLVSKHGRDLNAAMDVLDADEFHTLAGIVAKLEGLHFAAVLLDGLLQGRTHRPRALPN